MAMPEFGPAFELCWEMPSLSSSSASKFFFQRFIVAPTGERLRRWLDIYYTVNNFHDHVNNTMDNTNDISQGRLSGGGMQTRSRTASGTRRAARAKTATPRGPRGPRTPASTARSISHVNTDTETDGAPVCGATPVGRSTASLVRCVSVGGG